MQTFFNLSSKQAKGLDRPVFTNAEELYQNAKILAEHNSHGTASSLLILSLEETIKAIIIKLHSEGLKVYRIDGVQKFVKDHRIRHQIAQFIEIGSGLLEAYEDWMEAKHKPPRFKYKWLNDAANVFNAGIKFTPSLGRINKLESFDDLKNQGLYSEYKDGLKLPSNIIEEKEFAEVLSIVDRIRNFHRMLQITYKPVSKNSGSYERNEKLKADLELFVNEAFSEFSFKNQKY